MGPNLASLLPDPRRVLDWLPPEGVWRELWFTVRPGLGPVPDEPILADLQAAVAAGWAEDSGLVFGFDDDSTADGARSMRAYCTTPAGLAVKFGSSLAGPERALPSPDLSCQGAEPPGPTFGCRGTELGWGP